MQVHIINLEKDKDRWNHLSSHINDLNLHPHRFNAILGKNVKNEYDNHILPIAKPFIPKSVLGCGLSHILLAEHLYTTSDHNLFLILEDDVTPNFKNPTELIKVIDQTPQDWEIILLYSQGFIFDKLSACAYIINRKGLDKLRKLKLYTHIDIQRNRSNIKTYNSKKTLFTPNKSFDSHNDTCFRPGFIDLLSPFVNPFLHNQTISNGAGYKMLRLGTLELSARDLFDILIISLGVGLYFLLR